MFTLRPSRIAIVTAVFTALAGVSATQAAAAQTCIFDTYKPTAAALYEVCESYGYDLYCSTKGVQLYIRAQEGLTKEWLGLSVDRMLKQRQSCSPSVKPLQVSVTSAGNGFWVQLLAHDSRQAEVLLHWAQAIVQKHIEHIATPRT